MSPLPRPGRQPTIRRTSLSITPTQGLAAYGMTSLQAHIYGGNVTLSLGLTRPLERLERGSGCMQETSAPDSRAGPNGSSS